MDFDLDSLKKRYESKPGPRKTFIVPKRSIIQKYPKIIIVGGTILGLGIFFSRPIYDAFFRTDFAPTPATPEARREALLKAWKV